MNLPRFPSKSMVKSKYKKQSASASYSYYINLSIESSYFIIDLNVVISYF